jgi:hypothetical protein
LTLLPKIIRAAFADRLRQVEHFRRHPAGVQHEQLRHLLTKGAATHFGRDHDLTGVDTLEKFQARVPVREYEEFFPYIERARQGERNVLWRGETRWFARSSGTTAAKSKYIPVTREALWQSHMRGPRDCIAFNVERYPDTRVYGGKTLTLGGSRRIEREGEHALTGDLSAIMIENIPAFAHHWRLPRRRTALLADFEQKVERICRECSGKDVRSLAGVPSWNLVMLRRLLEYTGKSNLLEVWPNLELFIHGGVNFAPYRDVYRRLIPSPDMHYQETYNASEGFFGIADDFGQDMLLMLDYGIFFEFLPLTQLHDPSKAVPLEGVRKGVNYALIITSSGGLWRYLIGDTVRFTSTDPYRIRISGRTRQYINAFGEELIVDNAEQAMSAACRHTGAEVAEFSAAPVYMDLGSEGAAGAHQWVVEFRRAPEGGVEAFAAALDNALKEVNSDYEAKRWHDTTLCAPIVTAVPQGTFMRWMEQRGKAGGQNKVPRLANDRQYVDDILGYEL